MDEQEKKQGLTKLYTLLPVPFRLRTLIPIQFPVVYNISIFLQICQGPVLGKFEKITSDKKKGRSRRNVLFVIANCQQTEITSVQP
jgi:hypothetical protein